MPSEEFVTRFSRRLPKGYNGTATTFHRVGDLLPLALKEIGCRYQDRPDLILAAWPDIIGLKLAPMTRVTTFEEGILTVKVSNSTLYSLLSQHEKKRILERLRSRFPTVPIHAIHFRFG